MDTTSDVPAVAPSQMISDGKTDIGHPELENNYKIEMLSPDELLDLPRQDLLSSLNDIINDAYFVNGHPRNNEDTGPLFAGVRIQTQDQLVHELGKQGLLAICTDDFLPDRVERSGMRVVFGEPYRPGKYGKLVATASLKPWKGKTVDMFRRAQQDLASKSIDGDLRSNVPLDDVALSNAAANITSSDNDEHTKTWNWEIAACASAADPMYRGRGLMVRCVDALVEKLIARKNALLEAGVLDGDLMVKLWSSSLAGSGNTEYWMKRGFVKEGAPDIAPKGLWTATREFKIQTLSKVVG